jgi:hypothetical protein
MSTLRSKIEALAASFAQEVLAAMKSASFDEIASIGGGARRVGARGPGRPAGRRAGGGGKRIRRSMKDIVSTLDDVVKVVGAAKNGLRAEEIRDKLDLEAKQLPRVLKEGLATKRLRKKGEKRATTYFAGKGKARGSRKKGASTNGAPAAG